MKTSQNPTMHMNKESIDPFDPETLDLVVDGELTVDQLKMVCSAWDDDNAIWRQCALAFLESQQMRQALISRNECVDVPRRLSLRIASKFIGVAAVLGMCFFAGMMYSSIVSADSRESHEIQDIGVVTASSGDERVIDDQWTEEQLASRGEQAGRHVQHISLLKQQINGRNHYVTYEPLPPFMLQAIRDAGHDVGFVQEVVPVKLENDETVDVPVVQTYITDMNDIHL